MTRSRALRMALGGVAVLLALVFTAGLTRWDEPRKNDAIHPYVSYSGRVSAITDRRLLLIRDQESFDEMWRSHMGDRIERAGQGWPLTPTVDFNLCMVLAIFSGDRVNANGEQIESIKLESERLVVRYDTVTYQTASIGATDRGEPARPYGIFVLPRIDTTVVVHENTQNIIGDDPVWTERATFRAP
ncbi:MAG: hypothetical protein ACF8PN_16230 [Phycisphaerales bacterium]